MDVSPHSDTSLPSGLVTAQRTKKPNDAQRYSHVFGVEGKAAAQRVGLRFQEWPCCLHCHLKLVLLSFGCCHHTEVRWGGGGVSVLAEIGGYPAIRYKWKSPGFNGSATCQLTGPVLLYLSASGSASVVIASADPP